MIRREHLDAASEINLIPIFNLVVVLIPLLLLSVVFEELGVIDISTPRFVTPIVDPLIHEPPLNLSVIISDQGFTLTSHQGAPIPPVEGCLGAATICNRPGAPVADLLQKMRRDRARYDLTGDPEALKRSNEALAAAIARYDLRALYNTLLALKADAPETHDVTVSADPLIPFELLVATMDAARFKLASPRDDGRFDTDAAFRAAPHIQTPEGYAQLFGEVGLAVRP